MAGRLDGWTAGWMDGWMAGWLHGCMARLLDGLAVVIVMMARCVTAEDCRICNGELSGHGNMSLKLCNAVQYKEEQYRAAQCRELQHSAV